jgi:hypothetical protein
MKRCKYPCQLSCGYRNILGLGANRLPLVQRQRQ